MTHTKQASLGKILGHGAKFIGRNVGRGTKFLTEDIYYPLAHFGNTAGRFQGLRNISKNVAKPFYNYEKGRGTAFGIGATGYGMAGLVGDVTGAYHLPGSELALAGANPLTSLAYTAPSFAQASRLRDPEVQRRIEQDVLEGARIGAADYLDLVDQDKKFATTPGMLDMFNEQYNPAVYAQTDNFREMPARLSLLNQIGKLWGGDVDSIVNNAVDHRIYEYMNKSGSVGGALKLVGKGLGKALGYGWQTLPWLGMGGVGFGTYNALATDRPYDQEAVMQKGYAASHAKIDKQLEGLSAWQKAALGLDPTLLGSAVEKALPGTLQNYAQSRGTPYKLGWLADFKNNFDKGGSPQYYTTDHKGNLNYL